MSKEQSVALRRRIEALLRAGGTLDGLAACRVPAQAAARRRGPDRATVLSKLAETRSLTKTEVFFARSILLPELRPVFDVADGSYAEVSHPSWTILNEPGVKARVTAALSAAGRVQIGTGRAAKPVGSCVLVGPDLVMTNRHVATTFAFPSGTGGGTMRAGFEVGVDFLAERGRDRTAYVPVEAVVMMHPYWDMALLRLAETPAGAARLALSTDPADAPAGAEAVILGYPGVSPDEDVAVQTRVMDGAFDVKRIQPGELHATLAHDPATSALEHVRRGVRCVGHDSSTLGGNSGSAVVSLATGRVVGLHFWGVYDNLNWAIPTADLARDGRVVDAGLNFDGAGASAPGPWDAYWATA